MVYDFLSLIYLRISCKCSLILLNTYIYFVYIINVTWFIKRIRESWGGEMKWP